jgi:tetratricopeptide (TPR) repeat protein
VAGIRRERALLLARCRRYEEAQAAIEQALEAAESGGLHTEMPLLLKVASRVCEEAGRFNEALVWLRKSQAATDALQVRRATSQAAVLQAEAQTDALRHELDAALRDAKQLALENHVLKQRLLRHEGSGSRGETEFLDALCLRTILQPRHADARAMDLPFCIALLWVENVAVLQPLSSDLAAPPWLRALRRALDVALGKGQDVVHWRPGLFVHALAGQGERRARETCQRVQAELAAFAWERAQPVSMPVPRVRVIGIDAARHATLDEALGQLLRMAQREGELVRAGDAPDPDDN